MAWYAAHIVCFVRFCDGVQDSYPIWENVILIEAETDDAARDEAERIGQTYYDDTDLQKASLTWNDRPANWVFAGIRKLLKVTETAATITEQAKPWVRPVHGTEITYSEMILDSEKSLTKFVSGDAVSVLYEQ